MYQLTFMDCGELIALTSPSYRAIEAAYFRIDWRCNPRIWILRNKQPRLIA